jgi:hypothetical protein
MTGCVGAGPSEGAAVRSRSERPRTDDFGAPGRSRARSRRVVARIIYARVGVGRVYLQHLVHGDIEMVELVGTEVVPSVAAC